MSLTAKVAERRMTQVRVIVRVSYTSDRVRVSDTSDRVRVRVKIRVAGQTGEWAMSLTARVAETRMTQVRVRVGLAKVGVRVRVRLVNGP
jgi:hypothetical protein